MQTWLPPVISGIFSIVVVLIGAYTVSKREKRKYDEEHHRAIIVDQRKAVAKYIQSLYAASEQWKRSRKAADELSNIQDMHFAWQESLETCFLAFRNAGVELDLELTNEETRKAFSKLDSELHARYVHYTSTLTYNSVESWSEINLAKPTSFHIESLIANLATAARDNLH